eukprot:8655693-Pyramimonas_sp.AAC.1
MQKLAEEELNKRTEQEKCLTAAKVMIERAKAAGNKDLDKEAEDYIRDAEIDCRRFIDSNVQLFVTPGSVKKVAEAIAGSAAGKITLPSPKFRGIVFDPALHGEAIAYPNVRAPPVNAPILKARIA